MNYLEILKMSLSALKENKLRTILTMLAIIVGVFAIIASVTAVNVLDTYFNNTLSVMGGSVLSVAKYPNIRVGNGEEYRNRKNITFDDFERLQSMTRLARTISPWETFNWAEVVYSDKKTEPNIKIRGTNEFFLSNNSFEIELGRNFQQDDISYSRKVAIIGDDVRKELFKNEVAVGKGITVDGQSYTVIATLKAKGTVLGNKQDDIVVIPYTTGLQVYGGGDRDIIIQVSAPNMTLIPETMDELIGIMRTIRKVAPDKPNDFEINSNNSLKGTFESFTGYLYLFGFFVGGISLLGAGIGVMNIMLVSVTERTKEIGIRKAIGATRSAITKQFLTEAVFICQLGGIGGFLLGVIVGNLAALAIESEMVFPWFAAIGGIMGLTVIGLLFGVFPAMKAAKLDPIESLRYE
ncbi:FtsX-like permease family protein [bacterium]|nr:MAG: FtsX-like permease family protein [bacterium]